MAGEQRPERGQDSRVEDWFGQSVERDRQVAEEIADDPEDVDEEAEAEFRRRASGREEQAERRGEDIDPDQGRSAYADED